jgi:hypothetical protein
MAAGHEDPGLRRQNYHHTVHELIKLCRSFRDGYDERGPVTPNTDYRIDVPNSTARSPRVGDMNDLEIAWWARRMAAAVAEMSINQTNEALARAKLRAGEAA